MKSKILLAFIFHPTFSRAVEGGALRVGCFPIQVSPPLTLSLRLKSENHLPFSFTNDLAHYTMLSTIKYNFTYYNRRRRPTAPNVNKPARLYPQNTRNLHPG